MLPYIAIYVIIAVFGTLRSLEIVNIKDQWFFIPITLLLIIFAGTRYEIGNDWYFYKQLFESANVKSIFHSVEAEPSFQILFIIFKFLGLSFSWLVFWVAFYSISLKSAFILKYSPIPLVSLIVLLSYFLVGEMGQIRQMFAIAICLWSIPFLLNKKPSAFIFTVLVACTFHYSAFAFLLVYPVYIIHWNWKTLVLFTGVVVLFALFSWFGILPWLTQFAPKYVQHKFAHYYTPDFLAFKHQTFWYRLGFLAFCYMLFRDEKNEVLNLSMRIYALGIFFLVLLGPIETLSGRGSMYFKIFEIILVPYIIQVLRGEKWKQALVFSIFLIYHSRHFIVGIYKYKEFYIPYKSILFNLS